MPSKIKALWDLLDKALEKFGEATERRRKARKFRKEIDEIDKRKKREDARIDALVAANQAKLKEIMALTDDRERRKRLAAFEKERERDVN